MLLYCRAVHFSWLLYWVLISILKWSEAKKKKELTFVFSFACCHIAVEFAALTLEVFLRLTH